MSEKLSNRIHNDLYFDYLVKDIINNEEFLKIKDIPHHNTTDRYSHSLSVSYYAYRISKLFNVDVRSVARAGLLHDFYFEIPYECKNKERIKLLTKEHPQIAYKNSKKNFEINIIEEDAIKSHMYPLNLSLPRYKESWIVSLSDKFVSFKEASHSFRYAFNIITVFLLNWLLK